jgi:hypothetical protein
LDNTGLQTTKITSKTSSNQFNTVLPMRYLSVTLLTLLFTNLCAQQQRSLNNLPDRKYFYGKLSDILKGAKPSGSDWIAQTQDYLDTDTFGLNMESLTLKAPEKKKEFEQVCVQIAGSFWCKLLKDFPQFKFFSILYTDEQQKKTALTFHYLGKNEVEYYSRNQQEVVHILLK